MKPTDNKTLRERRGFGAIVTIAVALALAAIAAAQVPVLRQYGHGKESLRQPLDGGQP